MISATPLHHVHQQLGAVMTDFAGWSMPVRYGSDRLEHHAVRQRAGLFDLSHMGEIEVDGPQAAEALDYALVSELSRLDVGRAKYSLLCDRAGGILDDVVVYRRTEESYLVVANAANTSVVSGELGDRCRTFKATVTDASSATALLALQGPAAAGILESLEVEEARPLGYYRAARASIDGVPVWLARTGYTGEDGFEFFFSVEHAEHLWTKLREAGESAGLVPAGLAARDTLRMEAGMPLYGNELGPQRTPIEAGLQKLLAFESDSDFVGRAALESSASRPARQQMVGLVGSGRRAARTGYTVLRDGSIPAGEVTSGALSPTLELPIAMAYVDAEVAAVGTRLTVDVRGDALPVEVVELPFYRRLR